jgi:hypothetical protein
MAKIEKISESRFRIPLVSGFESDRHESTGLTWAAAIEELVQETIKRSFNRQAHNLKDLVSVILVRSLDDVIAHLAWCLHLLGEEERAERITPPTVRIVPDPGIAPPKTNDLDALIRVAARGDHYAIGTLGIPGKSTVAKLTWHGDGPIRVLDEKGRSAA